MNSWDDEMLWGWTAMDTQRQCSQCHTNTVKILMFAMDFYSNFKKGILKGPRLLRLNVKKINLVPPLFLLNILSLLFSHEKEHEAWCTLVGGNRASTNPAASCISSRLERPEPKLIAESRAGTW